MKGKMMLLSKLRKWFELPKSHSHLWGETEFDRIISWYVGFNRWYDFTELTNFQIMVQEGLYSETMLKELLANKKTEDSNYLFRLSKANYVYRLSKLDGEAIATFHSTAEKRTISQDQTKLLEVLK